MHIKKLLAALILCLSVVATPVGAAPMEDENPCDPDNGKYICDGTQDWPNGDCPPELCGPKLPSTGVSDPSDDLSALFDTVWLRV